MFDVYPMHANFISILTKQLSIYQNKQKVKDLKLEQAIIKVKHDVVNIFLGIETLVFEGAESYQHRLARDHLLLQRYRTRLRYRNCC